MLFPVFSAMSLDAVKSFVLTQQTAKQHIKLDSPVCGLPAHCAADQLVVAIGATAHQHMAEAYAAYVQNKKFRLMIYLNA